MRSPLLTTLSLAVITGTALAQGTITSTQMNTLNDPFNLAPGLNGAGVLAPNPILDRDASGTMIDRIEQIELRHMSGTQYRVALTAALVGASDTSMVSGVLDLGAGQGSGTWTPNNSLDLLNTTNSSTDEFQVSLTANGLVVVWDNYAGWTYNTSAGAQSGNTFICTRPNTSSQFQVADVRVIGGGIGGLGGVDPHIAQDDAGSGNILLAYIEFSSAMDIRTAVVTPSTGAASNVQPLLTSTGAGAPMGAFNFMHSPFSQRDSNGKPRAITVSEYDQNVGGGSHGWWNSNHTDSGAATLLADQRLSSTGANAWFANPAVVGGTWMWATAEGGYERLTVFEGTTILDTNAAVGDPIVLLAPMRPGYPTGYTNSTGGACSPGFAFISGLAIDPAGGGPTLSIPVVTGMLIQPTIVVGLFFHNPNTGAVEIPLTPIVLPSTYSIQAVTFDLCNGVILASNVATAR